MKTEGASEHCLDGPVGTIELRLKRPEEDSSVAFIMCHPHSLHGGSMNNKVVTTAMKAASSLGATCATFNFRGVGKSEGQFDDGMGEQQDLLAVVEWLQQQGDFDTLWLGGFSFGSFVAASMATKLNAERCLSIAPPVHHFDFSSVTRGDFIWGVIQGEEDEIVEAQQVYDWYETLSPPSKLIRMPKACHFFHGQLLTLGEHVTNLLTLELGK